MIVILIDDIDFFIKDEFLLFSIFNLIKIPYSNLIFVCTWNIKYFAKINNSQNSIIWYAHKLILLPYSIN